MTVDVVPTTAGAAAQSASRVIRDVQETTCCIVGGGPAGAVLALLLAASAAWSSGAFPRWLAGLLAVTGVCNLTGDLVGMVFAMPPDQRRCAGLSVEPSAL